MFEYINALGVHVLTDTLGPYQPASGGANDNVLTAALQIIETNLPGILLLFLLSGAFSAINFYSALRARHAVHPGFKYLLAWIFVNFFFSLLILLLILPPAIDLSVADRTLLVYCVLATAIPEIATNLKLQFGETTRGIDLYKYKARVSKLISARMDASFAVRQALQLQSLAFYYFGRPDRLAERITAFGRQDLIDTERVALCELQSAMRDSARCADILGPLGLNDRYEVLIPKLLDFFAEDVKDYLQTPEARLMRRLRHAHVSIAESRQLVRAGVISPGRFFRRARIGFLRRQLLPRIEIPEARLLEIYFECVGAYRKRLYAALGWGSVTMVAAAAAALLVVQLERKSTTYDPASLGQPILGESLSGGGLTGTLPGPPRPVSPTTPGSTGPDAGA